jgi:hypothetical protein
LKEQDIQTELGINDSITPGKKMRTIEDIKGLLSARRDELDRFSVEELWVFGSAVRGEATLASDLDFLVDLEKKTFDNYMGLRCFLEDLFGCPIDLVTRDALRPCMRDAVLREAIHAA